MNKVIKQSAALGVLALCATTVTAQQAPDAGRTLQQQPRPLEQPPQTLKFDIEIPDILSAVAPGGPKVTINSLKFEGNTRLTADALNAALLSKFGSDYLKGSLDLSQIWLLADTLTQTYQASGYPFAKVFVPAQSMADGLLKLQVVEGQYGQVNIEAETDLVRALEPYFDNLKAGEVIEASELERSTLIASDLPGIRIEPVVRPGQQTGQGDLIVKASRAPSFQGDAGYDNFGSRFTGEHRLRLNGTFNSPFTVGDQLQLRTIATTEALYLGSASYSLPVGSSGLRALGSFTHTQYELGKEFSATQANGTAEVIGAGFSYPLVRSQARNLSLSAQWQHKHLNDRQDVAGLNTVKSSQSIPISFNFDVKDQLLGSGAITYGSLTFTTGQLNLDPSLQAADRIGDRVGGDFDKTNMDLARLQSLSQTLSLFIRGSVQTSNKNLDSSEGFSLGGSTGIRAYPSGEAFGDEGYFAQVELRQLMGAYMPYAFYDMGEITVRNSPQANSTTPNKRSLAGAGLGLKLYAGAWSLDTFVAWRTDGGRPTSDGTDRNPRLWVSVGYQF